jgi:hypothetical protein
MFRVENDFRYVRIVVYFTLLFLKALASPLNKTCAVCILDIGVGSSLIELSR